MRLAACPIAWLPQIKENATQLANFMLPPSNNCYLLSSLHRSQPSKVMSALPDQWLHTILYTSSFIVKIECCLERNEIEAG